MQNILTALITHRKVLLKIAFIIIILCAIFIAKEFLLLLGGFLFSRLKPQARVREHNEVEAQKRIERALAAAEAVRLAQEAHERSIVRAKSEAAKSKENEIDDFLTMDK